MQSPSPSFSYWTTHALDKVRPFDSPPSSRENPVSVYAARNEFEPFQVVLRAEGQPVDDIDVEISDLHGPQNSLISSQNATIYFEHMMDIRRPSTLASQTGEWPDALIPRVDRYFSERRNAFPFSINPGKNQPIWIELYVPQLARPGKYHGEVHVNVHESRRFTIPVDLEVWNFTLPSTSSLPNTFGFGGVAALHQHYGKYLGDEDLLRLTMTYQKAALMHRISLHGGTQSPPRFSRHGDEVAIDWSTYDPEVEPLLDGTLIRAEEPLHGAKATTVDLRTSPEADNDRLKIQYWRAFAKHFREKGWIDRLFNYLQDEPEPADAGELVQKSELVHRADPQIRNLVTTYLDPVWGKSIDIWAPLINCFENRLSSTVGSEAWNSRDLKSRPH